MSRISTLITAILVFASGGFVAAQESIDELLWGDNIYVVTASKRQEHSSDAPATVIVITEEMIKERGYRDLKDVFNDLPGYDISTNVYGEFSTLITQRGIGGNNKIVLLLNSIQITSPSGKQFQFGNNVPIWNLAKIEIVYGPASALYGADAFSVINMITKTAEDGESLYSNLITGQNNTYDVYASCVKRISEDVSFSGFIRKYTSDGPDLLNRYPELSAAHTGLLHGYNDPTADMNLFMNLELNEISLSFHYSSYNEQLSKGLEPRDRYMYSEDSYWGHDIWQFALKHEYKKDKLSIKSDAIYRKFEIDPNMNWVYYSPAAPDGKFKVHQYGVMEEHKLESQLDYDFNKELNLIGGISIAEVMGLPTGDKNGEPFDKDGPLRLDNFYNDIYPQVAVQEREIAGYLQLRYWHTNGLSFIAGSRYDHNSNYGGTINPRLSVNYRRHNTTLKFMVGTAYIAPGLFHRHETWFATDYGHIPNPDLRPEILRTVETNWIQNISGKLKTSMSLYYNYLKDLIVRKSYGSIEFPEEWYEAGAGWVDADGDSAVFVEWNTNLGKLTSYGLDFSADYFLSPSLKLFATYSFLDGRTTDPETQRKLDIFKTSRHKFSGGFTYTVFGKLYITPRLRWVSDIATRLENSLYGIDRDGDFVPESPHEKMPGYKLVNLNLLYQDTFKGLEVHLTIYNLLNEKYYTAGVATEGSHTYLPRIPQNLRTITAGISYRFEP